jgi:iron complex transport system ATP-binding protein
MRQSRDKVSMGIIIDAQQVSAGYPQRMVLREITARLHGGRLVCLIGPNGAGKTTLLRTLAGLLPPLAGRVLLNDQPLHTLTAQARAQQVGLVLTDKLDIGNMTARLLVSLGRHPHTDWRGYLTQRDQYWIDWALHTAHAAELAPRMVAELSDGQRQKVLIARALAQVAPHDDVHTATVAGSALLLDEPTAFLDVPRRAELMRALRGLAHQQGLAVLLSTHDLELALRCADALWLLSAAGALAQGAPEDLALSGALGAAFDGEGVRFDVARGAFVLHDGPTRPIALHGDGDAVTRRWTARALERIGYHLSDDAPQAIELRGGGWHYNGAHYATLGALTAAVGAGNS